MSKITIVVDEGLIYGVLSDHEVEVLIIDYDVEGSDRAVPIKQINPDTGKTSDPVDANLSEAEVKVVGKDNYYLNLKV